MKILISRVLPALVLLFFISWLFFFAYAWFTYPAGQLLPRFFSDWVFLTAFIKVIENWVPIAVSAFLLIYSSLISYNDLTEKSGSPERFSTIVTVPLVFLVLLVALYSILAFGILPGLHASLEQAKEKTIIARDFEQEGRRALRESREYEAKRYFDLYLSIDPDNMEMKELSASLVSADMTEDEEERVEMKEMMDDEILRLSSSDLMLRANEYFQAGDYFSAHYYASRALEIDPGLASAKRLVAQSWTLINTQSSQPEQQREFEQYRQKQTAYDLLQQNRVIEAYFQFAELAERYPADPDIRQFLQESMSLTLKQTFFLSEIMSVINLPGVSRGMFRVKSGIDSYFIVTYAKMVRVREGLFFFGLELMKISSDGTVSVQVSAPYGKLMDGAINLLCYDNATGKSIPPVYIKGEPKGLGNLFQVPFSGDDLYRIGVFSRDLSRASIWDLISLPDVMVQAGFRKLDIQKNLVAHLLWPFHLIVLSVFAMTFGWRLRNRSIARPVLLSVFLLPILPLVISAGYQIYAYFEGIIVLALLVSAGFWLTAVSMIFIQAGLLLTGLLLMAGTATEQE